MNTGGFGQFGWGNLVWGNSASQLRTLDEDFSLATPRHKEVSPLSLQLLLGLEDSIWGGEHGELSQEVRIQGIITGRISESIRKETIGLRIRTEKGRQLKAGVGLKAQIEGNKYKSIVEITNQIGIRAKHSYIGWFWDAADNPEFERLEREKAPPTLQVFLTIEGERYEITDDIIGVSSIYRQLIDEPGEASKLVVSDVTITLDNSNKKFSDLYNQSILYGKEYLGSPVEIFLGFRTAEGDC